MRQPAPHDLSWLTRRPVAHRGLHDRARGIIENTLPAVRAAVAGDFAIEVDLQLTRDGEAVVFHDFTLERLTEEGGPLSARTAAELAKIPFRESDAARIFTLQTLLAEVAGRVPLVIELKSDFTGDTRLAVRATGILRDYAGPAALMSFDPAMVRAVAATDPARPRGIVAERWYEHEEWHGLSRWQKCVLGNLLHLPLTRPHFIAYGVRDLPALAPRLARRLLGLPLLTWTVRTPEQRQTAVTYADQMIFEGFISDCAKQAGA